MKRTAFSFPLALIMIAMVSLVSCFHDTDESAIVPSTSTIAGTYNISAYTFKVGTDPEQDMLSKMQPCERDDQFVFRTDKTYSVVDAATKCSPSQGYDSNWDILSATKMMMDGDEWDIEKFTGQILQISYTSNGQVARLTFNKP